MRKTPLIYYIIFIQILLLCIGFNKIVFQGGNHLFSHGSDGIKNDYTLVYYVQQPIERWDDFLSFKGMSYPTDDHVFFTDNTPLISMPLRVLNHFIPLSEGAILHLGQLFFILCILLSSIVLYHILKRFIQDKWLLSLGAICLPLLDPQLLRLGHGILNLSLSLPTLLAILFLIQIIERQDIKASWKFFVGLFMFAVVCGLTHIYYLPIIGAFLGVFFLSYLLIEKRISLRQKILTSSISLGSYFSGALLLFAFLKLTDGKSTDRLADPQGYNYIAWRLDFNSLFDPHNYLYIGSIFNVQSNFYYYESVFYLGSWIMLFIVIATVATLYLFSQKKFKYIWRKELMGHQLGRLFLYATISAVFGIILALGNQYHIQFLNIKGTNYLNPFYWLNEHVDMIRQFRAISRFAYPAYFSFNLIALFLLQRFLLRDKYKDLGQVLKIIVLLIWVLNSFALLGHTNREFSKKSVFTSAEKQSQHNELLAGIKMSDYDALLTLPAYYNGTGDYPHTIDPYHWDWMSYTMSISAAYHIPLFSRNMSRGAISPQHDLVNMLAGNNDNLKQKIKGKTILIIIAKDRYKDKSISIREPAATAYWKSEHFVNTLGDAATLIKKQQDIEIYRWEVKD